MGGKSYLLVHSLGYPNVKQQPQQYQYEECSLKMLFLMQTSESGEGPSAHKLLTHLGKLTQAWVYIEKHPKQ